MFPFTGRTSGERLTNDQTIREHVGEETLVDCYVLGFQPSDPYNVQTALVRVHEEIDPGSMKGIFLGTVPQSLLAEDVHFPIEDQSFISLGKGTCNIEDFRSMLHEA